MFFGKTTSTLHPCDAAAKSADLLRTLGWRDVRTRKHPPEDPRSAQSAREALASGGALPLSAGLLAHSLYFTAVGETRMFLSVSQPRTSSVFGLRQLLRRHGPADDVLAFLDLPEHWGSRFFGEQIPHISGNACVLEARVLSVIAALNIFDLGKMLG